MTVAPPRARRANLHGSAQEHTTFCRICEQLCGLTVTVENDTIVKIRPDDKHPLTAGFACPKGIAIKDIQNDPERLTHPLRRTADGGFERVSWETALHEIGDRLRNIRTAHGNDSVGIYVGNPSAFSSAMLAWAKGFADGMETPHIYSSGSQDTNSRFTASHFLYGSPFTVPVPDLPRTDFLLMLGANPVISHGSLIAGGLIRNDLDDIVKRGGRVVVVDPRRTESAARFEHVGVLPDGDAWLLLSLLHVIFAERLEAPQAFEKATGAAELRALAARFDPERTEARSGVPAEVVRTLARDFAAAPSGAVYGRTGACLGAFSTLVNFLLDALNVVTGNLDRPGGAVFASPAIDLWAVGIKAGMDTYATKRSRVGDYPEVISMMPAGIIAEEIETPGPGQLRALIVSAGNPVLTVPDSAHLDAALNKLELMVAVDLYKNETNNKADYLLPGTTFLEREDANVFVQQYQYRRFIQWTGPVVRPRGEAREEWRILRDISAELGIVPSSSPLLRRLGRVGRALTPGLMFDLLLRMGPDGDRFGLRRSGLSRKKLLNRPSGVLLDETVPTGVLSKHLTHDDGLLHLAPTPIAEEIARLEAIETVEGFPLRLFGRRELRSINSWMHNSAKLNPKQHAPGLLVHPLDAEELGLVDGGAVRITSPVGTVQTFASISDTVIRGSVSLPHAWGHNGSGGWSRSNATGGANYNVLAPAGVGRLEPLAAMAVLNGVSVRVEAISAAAG